MEEITAVLKDCHHGMPKFLCRRCSPRVWRPPPTPAKTPRKRFRPSALAKPARPRYRLGSTRASEDG